MTEIKNVSRTAFVVAEFRAEENTEGKPLIPGFDSQIISY
jgi:hypothetical protein